MSKTTDPIQCYRCGCAPCTCGESDEPTKQCNFAPGPAAGICMKCGGFQHLHDLDPTKQVCPCAFDICPFESPEAHKEAYEKAKQICPTCLPVYGKVHHLTGDCPTSADTSERMDLANQLLQLPVGKNKPLCWDIDVLVGFVSAYTAKEREKGRLEGQIAEADPTLENYYVPQHNHINSSDYDRGWNDCWDKFWYERNGRTSTLVQELAQLPTQAEGERQGDEVKS